jgi:hypothetical protein
MPTGLVAASGAAADVWLYNQIKAVAGPGTQLADKTLANYRGYKVRDLPPRFIIHNEQIIALIFSEYVRHVGFSKFIQALKESNNELLRVCASGVALLFKRLCDAGLPIDETLTSLIERGQSINRPQPYLLPLAYADYFTGYRSNTRDEFESIFEGAPYMSSYATYYWEGERQNVRATVPLTNRVPRWEDLTNIAIALGITQSTPE